jgi:hypothetical protein
MSAVCAELMEAIAVTLRAYTGEYATRPLLDRGQPDPLEPPPLVPLSVPLSSHRTARPLRGDGGGGVGSMRSLAR